MLAEVNQLALASAKLKRALIVAFGFMESSKYNRIFVHVIQTCSGVNRHPRSSVHLRTGNGHQTANNLSIGGRSGG